LRGIRDKVSGSKTNVFSGWMRAEWIWVLLIQKIR
jgi:hypothetical protein